MATKKFMVEIAKVIEVEINTSIIDYEFMALFSDVMFHVSDHEEIAKFIAEQYVLRDQRFAEGIGHAEDGAFDVRSIDSYTDIIAEDNTDDVY